MDNQITLDVEPGEGHSLWITEEEWRIKIYKSQDGIAFPTISNLARKAKECSIKSTVISLRSEEEVDEWLSAQTDEFMFSNHIEVYHETKVRYYK